MKIDADDKTLREILDIQKYTIDYFQREYRWERKHIEQLITDLEACFFSNYKHGHERRDVANYNSYFLGPIVICNKGDSLSIIDGQQRLTSITLLLIYIHHLQKTIKNPEPIESLIRSTMFGIHSYNLYIDERTNCFDKLYECGEYNPSEKSESVLNIVERYQDIEELFPQDLKGDVLPFFIDWLKEKTIFVKIVSYSEENAYTIFETMNDRGLNLNPTEMLKGYLLSKVPNNLKSELNQLWRKRIAELHEWDKFEDLEFFKAWLRAKYADTIRPGRKGAANEDFEKIGTSFHTWVRDKRNEIGINRSSDFTSFVNDKFGFYSKLYQRIANAEHNFTDNLEHIYYIGQHPIAYSLMYPLLMAPIKIDDAENIINKKLNIIAKFIETFIIYRSVNYRTLAQSSIRYTVFSLVKEIRDRSVDELVDIFKDKIEGFEEGLSGISEFGLHSQNKRFVRYLLARITNFIEVQSGIPSSFETFMSDSINKPFEIEHIWSDNFGRHEDEFSQRDEFNTYRNKIGGLLLLPRGINQSFSNDPYEIKLPHYLKENLLSRSLNASCYERNPNFINFIKSCKINFKPHEQFKKQDLLERTELYKNVCEVMWSPDGFDQILSTTN